MSDGFTTKSGGGFIHMVVTQDGISTAANRTTTVVTSLQCVVVLHNWHAGPEAMWLRCLEPASQPHVQHPCSRPRVGL